MKTCKDCKKTRELSEYYVYKNGNLWSSCKSCQAERGIKWKANNRERARYLNARSNYKIKYGLEYDEVVKYGTCPLCLVKDKRLVCDHDHKSGLFRGFICYKCNNVLSHIENKEKMQRIRKYLNENPCNT